MNSKFFDVKKDKQDSIINAALKVFASKGYKDASTDVIVKAAGISKGLLFHYFLSKKGLYEFICDYSVKYMTLELTRSVKTIEKDYFTVLSQIEMGRCRVARNYPYMQQFLSSLKFEKEADAIEAMGNSIAEMETTYKNILAQVNSKKFINPDGFEKLSKIVGWVHDEFEKEMINEGVVDPDVLYEEYMGYLELLRTHFYKSDDNESLSIAKEEVFERDETIMDGMKMEMTFEERLMAGKRPLVEAQEADKDKSTEKADEVEKIEAEDSKEASAKEDDVKDDDEALTSSDNAEKEDSSDNEVATDIKEDTPEEDFFDEEDEGDEEARPLGLPKVGTGEIKPFASVNMPTMNTTELPTIPSALE